MELLEELVTPKTPVIKLSNLELTEEERIQVAYGPYFKLNNRDKAHLNNMYSYDDSVYYFKKEEDTFMFEYDLIHELLGTYLARELKLETVSYDIASVDGTLGLASKDFKDWNKYSYIYPYMTLPEMDECTSSMRNIDRLITKNQSKRDTKRLMDQLIKLFALDIYMIQRDRHGKNFQFKRNKKTNALDLAPIYDYGRCLDHDNGLLSYATYIMCMNNEEYRKVINLFPELERLLDKLIKGRMVPYIERIFDDYNLDKDSYEYERIIDYFYEKETRRKEDIKKYLLK